MAVLRIVALATVVAVSFGCAGRDVRGPFNNQYVDAETGKPIEGVVFLVVWNSLTPNLVDGGGQKFYEAREAISGPDGRVEISALSLPIWRIALEVQMRDFVSGGYVSESVKVTPTNGQRHVDPTVTLMRQTSVQERCKRLPFASGMVSAEAMDKSPRYAEAISRERSELKCDDSRRGRP